MMGRGGGFNGPPGDGFGWRGGMEGPMRPPPHMEGGWMKGPRPEWERGRKGWREERMGMQGWGENSGWPRGPPPNREKRGGMKPRPKPGTEMDVGRGAKAVKQQQGEGSPSLPPPPAKEPKQSKGARAEVVAVLRSLCVSADLAGPELMEKLRVARGGEREGEGKELKSEGQVRTTGSGRWKQQSLCWPAGLGMGLQKVSWVDLIGEEEDEEDADQWSIPKPGAYEV